MPAGREEAAWLDEKFASFIWAHAGTATALPKSATVAAQIDDIGVGVGVVMSPAPRRQRQAILGAWLGHHAEMQRWEVVG